VRIFPSIDYLECFTHKERPFKMVNAAMLQQLSLHHHENHWSSWMLSTVYLFHKIVPVWMAGPTKD
jgi:hypothetical protein